MSNILDASASLSSLPIVLPSSVKSLSSPQDGLTALVHAIMSALSFRLVGIDDSSSSRAFENNVLPDEWNSHGPGSYTLRYRHDQSSLEFLIKVSKLGSRTLINAIALETDKAATLDIATQDFTSQSFFPHTIDSEDSSQLVHGFISFHRVADFVAQYKLKIIQSLIPGLNQKGYIEESSATTTSSTRPDRSTPSTSEPRYQPPFASPYNPNPLFTPLPSLNSPTNPLSIGRRDLDPFPLENQPNLFAPPSLFPGPSREDGMYVGPNHPIFGREDHDPLRIGPPRRTGPWGGDGFLPPMGAPPGARFDPIGPFGGRGPFGTGGRNPGGPRGPGFGGPDNDEFMPPGSGDMFS